MPSPRLLMKRRSLIAGVVAGGALSGLAGRARGAFAQAADPTAITPPTAITLSDPRGRDNGPGRQVGNVGEVSVLLTVKPDKKEVLDAALRDSATWTAALTAVGTIHDARVVPLPNDQALVCITYDGPWAPYIDHFQQGLTGSTFWSSFEGFPEDAVDNPDSFRQWIADNQIDAAVWFVRFPDLTVTDIERQQKIAAGFEQMLDAVSS